jgi:hypothetical protein
LAEWNTACCPTGHGAADDATDAVSPPAAIGLPLKATTTTCASRNSALGHELRPRSQQALIDLKTLSPPL